MQWNHSTLLTSTSTFSWATPRGWGALNRGTSASCNLNSVIVALGEHKGKTPQCSIRPKRSKHLLIYTQDCSKTSRDNRRTTQRFAAVLTELVDPLFVSHRTVSFPPFSNNFFSNNNLNILLNFVFQGFFQGQKCLPCCKSVQ